MLSFLFNKNIMKKIGVYLFLLTLVVSCTTESNNQQSVEDKSFRESVLSNTVDNIIVPAHVNLLTNLESLQTAYNNFYNSVSEENFNIVKSEWRKSYVAWQYVELYNIGKAEQISYNLRSNTYPCNTTMIDMNIQNQMYDFSADNYLNYSSQGFPALDYMLYGIDSDTSNILNLYNTDNLYLEYSKVLIDELVINTQSVLNYWNDEKLSFVNSNGNTATSSLNMLINDFIYYYEKGFRANKIGIPAGVYSTSSSLPQNIEGYYSQYFSKTLALHALESSRKFFTGESFSSSQLGSSIVTYLNFLDVTNSVLTDDIISKFENSKQQLEMLDNNFVNQIQLDNMKMLATFDAIQEAVPLMKIQMLQALRIKVDYVDADGD